MIWQAFETAKGAGKYYVLPACVHELHAGKKKRLFFLRFRGRTILIPPRRGRVIPSECFPQRGTEAPAQAAACSDVPKP